MRQIKMIWDFRGPASKKIAEHHEIHLIDYARTEKTEPIVTGCTIVSEMHAMAFIVVNESIMRETREALKPHRGQVYNPN